MNKFLQDRISSLENQLSMQMELLSSYENKKMLSDDPKEIFRFEHEIEILKKNIEKINKELKVLNSNLSEIGKNNINKSINANMVESETVNTVLMEKFEENTIIIDERTSEVYLIDKRINCDYKNYTTIKSDILGKENGMLLIWVELTDMHFTSAYNQKEAFILRYHAGITIRSPKTISRRGYNILELKRIFPSTENIDGVWRFYCKGVLDNSTTIEYKERLNNGWHLFIIAWSKEENFIKLIIDNKEINETVFSNWPLDYSSLIFLGRESANKNNTEFHSKIGPILFYEEKFTNELLKNIMNTNY